MARSKSIHPAASDRPVPVPAPRQHAAVPGDARIPVSFFAVAVLFFVLGVSVLPFAVSRIGQYFYQAIPLAVVHLFTLGWITAVIMGVMYRYVPALTRAALPSPRLAWIQLALFVIGASGMITHFAIGIWPGLWLAAVVVFLSILMFAWNILPCLMSHVGGGGVAETGMFLSVCFLIAAALLGTLLGLDKTYDFLGGSLLTNLAAHVHLAAVGWVALSICAVSYRMLPAFLLPTIQLPAAAKWQIYALAMGAVGLAASLLLRSGMASTFAIAITLTMAWYVVIVARMLRARRMPLDWTALHALAGVTSLAIAAGLGIALSLVGGDSALGARLAPAYGAMGLLGFFSNFIIGMSYQLFPGFVARARTSTKRAAVTIAEISIARNRFFVFMAFNSGVLLLAGGFVGNAFHIARLGAALIAAAGLVYSAVTLWTLSFAFRESIPRAAQKTTLRILPE
jgi:hypothetical protein